MPEKKNWLQHDASIDTKLINQNHFLTRKMKTNKS